jgi:UDP-N-acetyl-D-mannosaminuronate dehydrogenase
MDHSLKDKTINIARLDYAGLPLALAFSEHPGVVGFGVDSGHDHRLKR